MTMKNKTGYLIFAAALFALIYLLIKTDVIHKITRGKWISTKGGEVANVRQWVTYQNIIGQLNLSWARIPVEWASIEVSPGSYDWNSSEYTNLQAAVASAKRMGAEVILTVRDAPDFVIDPVYASSPDGTSTPWPNLCGRITSAGNTNLAHFIIALFQRLNLDLGLAQNSNPPVPYVELWNEPDVDPSQAFRPDLFGCWQRGRDSGNAASKSQPSYEAGAYYGHVLNSVAPAVKAMFPTVKFIAGAAFSPSTGFLPGVIDQAVKNIDVVSYHQYVKTNNILCDIDAFIAIQEKSFEAARLFLDSHGGAAVPILISEGAMGYGGYGPTAVPQGTATPAPSFYDCQAKFASALLTWSQERAKDGRLLGFIWYTVGINGWDETDLLYPDKTPKPVYFGWKN